MSVGKMIVGNMIVGNVNQTRITIETAKTDLQKHSNNTLFEISLLRKKTNKEGPKFDEVWQYFTQEKELNSDMGNGRVVGIPFKVVKNPFVLNLFKNLNLAYIPPFQTTLSGKL
ncbi:hypothetical protein RhiirA4_457242 [Rhizophagus irregularis]|uniref:Uncharacterized protein n=1 Tax=Rhizophagus irregularis TaxID=588596 RepID=A0A2I1G9H8_9GLOM|nr:hypothetical protein RhiirA4_457242 [Rhizophagus irregularis]